MRKRAWFRAAEPGQSVRAVPGAGLHVPIWILGSSLFGAQMAAAFGLPFAFASHFAPAQMEQAVAIYRSRFQPSEHLDKPYVMLGLSVVAAETSTGGGMSRPRPFASSSSWTESLSKASAARP